MQPQPGMRAIFPAFDSLRNARSRCGRPLRHQPLPFFDVENKIGLRPHPPLRRGSAVAISCSISQVRRQTSRRSLAMLRLSRTRLRSKDRSGQTSLFFALRARVGQ